jgi:hypothetical protein
MKRLLIPFLCLTLQAGGIPRDKLEHFGAGILIGAAVTVSFRWSGGPPRQSARIGFLVGTGAGIVKEGIDQYSYNTAKRLDAAYQSDAFAHRYVTRGTQAFGKGADAGDALVVCAGAALGSYLVFKEWQ